MLEKIIKGYNTPNDPQSRVKIGRFAGIVGIISNVILFTVKIVIGLLFGSILTDKQVGGICGGLLTNLSAWLSGTWFDLELVGGTFKKIAYMLPFVHAVEMEKALFLGDFGLAATHILPIALYSAAITALAVFCFLRQMKKQ